jgi:nucleoside-diphosphate-sugar epimerase
MNILITGGAGFLGSHLCDRLLSDGHSVTCVDNLVSGSLINIEHLRLHANFTFVNHDVTQPLPDDLRTEAVYHLASPASPNHHSKISYHALPLVTMMVNTVGTHELLKFAKKNNARFLFASTSEIYGDPLEHPQKEQYRGNASTTGPRSVYDEAKRFGETLTAHYWRTEGVDARIARIFNTYGPRLQKADMRMIVRFIVQALQDEPITIFGDGSQTRSLCYVSDTIDGLVALMFAPNTNQAIVNIGSPHEHSVMEYAEMVKKLTGSKSTITLSEQLPADDPLRRRPDIECARTLLGWEPKVSLEEGLKKMIEYIKTT